ncbi:MAG: hypothetical protein K8L97_27185 [Anaerolineae bacterium]|nr:hypothetical protein [Anaerolineae bacterium]
MTFDLRAILIFVVAALLYSAFLPIRWRGWALMIGSAVVIYWMQPPLPIRFSDFILPTATLCITAAAWWFTRAPEQPFTREDRLALGLLAAVIVGLSLMRFVDAEYRLTASRPPEPLSVVAWLAVIGLIVWVWGRGITPSRPETSPPDPENTALTLSHQETSPPSPLSKHGEGEDAALTPNPSPSGRGEQAQPPGVKTTRLEAIKPTKGAEINEVSDRAGQSINAQRRVLVGLIVVIVGLFVLIKTEALAEAVSGVWRGMTGQDVTLASALDLNWLGFSYVAFRLIHTARDRMMGILPMLTLREYVTYVIFFPAFTAGPIDRAERFVGDYRLLETPPPSRLTLRQAQSAARPPVPERGNENADLKATDGRSSAAPLQDATVYLEAGTRIFSGLLKKIVIADLLASGAALNVVNAEQAQSTIGLWLLLYGYGLRLFFDFSGYTDIAIGIGLLFGIRLPENFNRPYLKTNITAFWQSWHMTLSAWARAYVFSPLSRWFLMRQPKPSPMLIVLVTQCATMLVIGLWHGVTVNFLIWGLWHGLALWVHKQWSDRTRKWYRELKPGRKRVWSIFTWVVTFHYVVIGWVWFALPDVGSSLRVLAKLVGIQ